MQAVFRAMSASRKGNCRVDVRRTTGAGATLACLVAFLSLSACRDALRIDEAFLAQEGEATRAAFERVALPLPPGLAFRLVDAKTLEETLLQEFQRQARGEEWTAAKTEQAAREASVRVALRYDPVANEVRVAAENFERAALEAEAPLAGEDAVRGL